MEYSSLPAALIQEKNLLLLTFLALNAKTGGVLGLASCLDVGVASSSVRLAHIYMWSLSSFSLFHSPESWRAHPSPIFRQLYQRSRRRFFNRHSKTSFARPSITDEQEDFIRRLLEIPIGERSCRDLITLDTLYTYCGGPEPTPEARRLEDFARHQMDAAKERIKAAAARQREEKKAKGEATSTSVPRTVAKGSQKRKTDGVVIRPPKRQTVTPVKSPPTSGHGAGRAS
ncbi:uncharacterized protein LOC136061887 [Quercus suber]|uniref:uncharacterized protein LOC136061887 n=1 Tax=Quercus suber TaxID=58331 RepID=UPI0032DFA52E